MGSYEDNDFNTSQEIDDVSDLIKTEIIFLQTLN